MVLRFDVDANGRVQGSSVVTSSGSGRLDRTAQNAMSKCRFDPQLRDGVPEAGAAQVRFAWKLGR